MLCCSGRSAAASSGPQPGTDSYAQRTFAGAKSISSDQYFGLDKKAANDPETKVRTSSIAILFFLSVLVD